MINTIKNLINKIRINNQSINISNVSGKSISIINGKVIIDGVDVTPDSKNINIEITGNVNDLEIGACNQLTVTGDVQNLKVSSANVNIGGSVTADVTSSTGDIDISGSVTGNVKTSTGDVDVNGTVGGSIKTSTGSIKYKKM